MLAPVSRRVGVLLAVCGVGLALAGFLVGRTSNGAASGHAAPSKSAKPRELGFAVLPTRKCHTVAVGGPPAALSATTRVAMPASIAKGMAAYRDTHGTMVIAPVGWECEAGIGADGGESVTAFPPGKPIDPTKPEAGQAVALEVAAVCIGCAAGMACTVLPNAPVVHENEGSFKCKAKALREQVTHISSSFSPGAAALFYDPPGVRGSGLGSGGEDPSLGGVATSQSGAHKISCTLPADLAEACAGIVSASLLAAPLY